MISVRRAHTADVGPPQAPNSASPVKKRATCSRSCSMTRVSSRIGRDRKSSVCAETQCTLSRAPLGSLAAQLGCEQQELLLSSYWEPSQCRGHTCVDAGHIPGSVGQDVEPFFFRSLKRRGPWPIEEHVHKYSEVDLFDVIELVHECVSKGVDRHHHSWGECRARRANYWKGSTLGRRPKASRCEFSARTHSRRVLRDEVGGRSLTRH